MKVEVDSLKAGVMEWSAGYAKKIEENAAELLATLMRLKPSSAKGAYMKSVAMSSTMGPGIKIEQKTATA